MVNIHFGWNRQTRQRGNIPAINFNVNHDRNLCRSWVNIGIDNRDYIVFRRTKCVNKYISERYTENNNGVNNKRVLSFT
jgi:hypothetical protein